MYDYIVSHRESYELSTQLSDIHIDRFENYSYYDFELFYIHALPS
jgi:hypothetical protein